MIAYEIALRLPTLGNNAYEWHQWLWQQLSPSAHVDCVPSFCYRTVEVENETFALLRLPELLLQKLQTQSLVRKVICPIDARGQRICFSVRLCPLYRTERNRERTPSDVHVWAHALFSRNGFNVQSVAVGKIEKAHYEKPGQKSIPHDTRIFSFIAEIGDCERAQHAWLHGIGRRKSTGCGLLVETSP